MAIPAPPPGFQLVQGPASGGAPEPPPGFVMVEQQKPYRASDEMSDLERLVAGAGYGAKSAYEAIAQLGARGAGVYDQGALDRLQSSASPMGAVMAPARAVLDLLPAQYKQQIGQQLQGQITQDSELYRGDLGKTGYGIAGNILGAIGATAPLSVASLPTKAMTIPQMMGASALTGAGQAALSTPATGKPEDFAQEKAGQAALGGAFGAGTSALLRGVGAAAERLLPSNLSATVLNALSSGANKTKFAQEGEQLAQRTGVELTPAAISGGKAQTMAENVTRQSIFSRDKAFEADAKISQQISDYIDRVASKISGKGEDAASIGKRVSDTVASEVNRLSSRRSAIGGQLYAEVDDMAKGAPLFRPQQLRAELEKVIAENKGVIAADAEKAAGWAQKQLEALGESTGLRKLIQNRRFWSAAAAGKGNLFENASPGIEQRIAARMLSAIDQDLDNVAGTLGGPIGDKLRQANKVWRDYSQAIEGMEASPLGKIMGEEFSSAFARPGTFSTTAPEKWVARIRQLEPSQVDLVRDFMSRKNPEAWDLLRRRVIDDALETAQAQAPSAGANTLAMNGGAFINALAKTPKDQAKLKAMFKPQELREIYDAFDVIRRAGDKTGFNFSGTAGANEALGLFNTLKNASVNTAASVGGQVLGTRAIANLMMNGQGRRALLQLAKLPPQSARARELAAYVSSVMGGQQVQAMQPDQENYYDPNRQ